MTTEEIKTLLYNIFGVKFNYTKRHHFTYYNNFNSDFFEVHITSNNSNAFHLDLNTNNYHSFYLDILTADCNYNTAIHLLQIQKIYGFIKDINNVHCCISFVPYSELKNIDI